MNTYHYKAKKPTAETVDGQIHASTQEEAIEIISNLGLTPVSVEAQTDKDLSRFGPSKRIRTRDTYLFTRQLSNMLKSGVGILRALFIIEEQTQHPALKNIVSGLAASIKNGKSFSSALGEHPHVFSPLFLMMVKAGEESGRLQEMLVNITVYQQKYEEMMGKIRTALVYPLLMLLIGLGTVYFILTFTMPKMTAMFGASGHKLPLLTKILLSLSKFCSDYWFIILIVIFAGVLFLEQLRKSDQGRQIISLWLFKIPMVSGILIKSDMARFSQTMGLLLKSGIPIVQALEASAPVVSSFLIRQELEKNRTDIIAGLSWAESLKKAVYIPSMVKHMIAVGEESGNLNDILAELTSTYEQETDEKLKIFTTLFEPLMIIFIGSLIAVIVFAMLLPIFQFDLLGG